MRDYLLVSNLSKASAIGGVATLMSVPRLIQAGVEFWIYLPVVFGGMTLSAAAVTAWSNRAGMCGMFPSRRRMLTGLGIAAVLACTITPIYSCWLDPIFRHAIAATGDRGMLRMRYPVTLGGCITITLWSASFETVFFRAATMSFFARLTGSLWISLIAAVGLRIFVILKQLSTAGIVDAIPLFVVCTVIVSFISCVLFARTGLPGTVLFSVGLNFHLFISLLRESSTS